MRCSPSRCSATASGSISAPITPCSAGGRGRVHRRDRRERVRHTAAGLRRAGALGIAVDAVKNAKAPDGVLEVQKDGMPVKVLVIRTNEEREIALQTMERSVKQREMPGPDRAAMVAGPLPKRSAGAFRLRKGDMPACFRSFGLFSSREPAKSAIVAGVLLPHRGACPGPLPAGAVGGAEHIACLEGRRKNNEESRYGSSSSGVHDDAGGAGDGRGAEGGSSEGRPAGGVLVDAVSFTATVDAIDSKTARSP